MWNEFKRRFRSHYAPAWRYTQILIDIVMAIFVFGFVFPSLYIFWRAIWRIALGCEL